MVGERDDEGVAAVELARRLEDGLEGVALVVLLDQVDDDLGVGLALDVVFFRRFLSSV